MSNKPNYSKQRVASARAGGADGGGRGAWWIAAVAAAAIIVAVIVAVVATGDDSATTADGGAVVTEDFGPVELTSAGLREFPGTGAPDPAVGTAIPTVTGQGFDGSAVTIEADGTPKVLVFLAHWCPHCQEEVPVLQEWFDANGLPDDVDVISVATGSDPIQPNFPPSEWLLDEGWSPPVLVDDEETTAANAFGLSGFPFFVVVDAEGDVVQRLSGRISVEQWEQLLALARGGDASVGETGPASGAS